MAKATECVHATKDYYGMARAGELVGYRYEAEGVTLTCPVCGCDVFDERRAVVVTRFLAFLRLEWLNRGAWILDCARCGHLSWFSKMPTRIDDEQAADGPTAGEG